VCVCVCPTNESAVAVSARCAFDLYVLVNRNSALHTYAAHVTTISTTTTTKTPITVL